MRTAGYLLVAVGLVGCGSATAASVPPVLDLPVPPGPREPRRPPPPPPPASSTPPAPAAPPWGARLERSESTKPVGKCQVGPFTFASTFVVENRRLDADHVTMRVVQDDEKTTGVTAPPSLLGKAFTLARGPGGVTVTDDKGAAVPDDQAARVLPLATAALGWPGADVAAHVPATGAEVASLEGPVAVVASVPLHGGEVPPQAKAVVKFAATKKTPDGDELLFDVTLSAKESDAGMCHRWSHVADTKGTLRLRAADGALLGVHLEGTTSDSEGLCMNPGDKPGPPPAPHACNKGSVTVEMRQPRVP